MFVNKDEYYSELNRMIAEYGFEVERETVVEDGELLCRRYTSKKKQGFYAIEWVRKQKKKVPMSIVLDGMEFKGEFVADCLAVSLSVYDERNEPVSKMDSYFPWRD